MTRGRSKLVVAAALGVIACAGGRTALRAPVPELAWPPGAPHVRLEALLEAQDERGAGRVFSLVTGDEPEPLFQRPHGVAWDGDALLVTDPGARRVVRIDRDDKITFSPAGAVADPIGVASCPQGIVVTDSRSGQVALLDRRLHRVAWLAQELERPTGVTCVGDRMFVVETGRHRLLIRDPAGEWQPFGRRGVRPGEFNFPTAITRAEGSIWVGDTLNFRVQELDATEASLAAIAEFGQIGDTAGAMPRLKGIAVDRLGNLWVSDAWLDQVSLYTREGALLMSLGGKGRAAGRFSFPAGIAAHDDGRVAVVDALNRRVQIFAVLDRNSTGDPSR